jgi:hypothetical protein
MWRVCPGPHGSAGAATTRLIMNGDPTMTINVRGKKFGMVIDGPATLATGSGPCVDLLLLPALTGGAGWLRRETWKGLVPSCTPCSPRDGVAGGGVALWSDPDQTHREPLYATQHACVEQQVAHSLASPLRDR